MIIVRNEKGRRVVKSGLEGCDWRLLASGGGGDSWVETRGWGLSLVKLWRCRVPHCSYSPVGEKWEDKNGVRKEGCRR